MQPDDRVLVVYVPHPADFRIIQEEGWYRVPARHAPNDLSAEVYAFYFGSRFGKHKWAIHAFAQRRGHELVRRVDLFPDDLDHARAEHVYYKVQLGPIQWLERPIISLRWRRLLFLHTTWDRFEAAREIRDLLLQGPGIVSRRESGLD